MSTSIHSISINVMLQVDEYRSILMYKMLWSAPQSWCAHLKSESLYLHHPVIYLIPLNKGMCLCCKNDDKFIATKVLVNSLWLVTPASGHFCDAGWMVRWTSWDDGGYWWQCCSKCCVWSIHTPWPTETLTRFICRRALWFHKVSDCLNFTLWKYSFM